MEIKGIDVSAWQGQIDWDKVASYGMDFVFIRITEAGNVIDSCFERNFSGCKKHNIPVGVYKYSYAMTIAEIQSEARKVVSVLNGRKLQYGSTWNTITRETSELRGSTRWLMLSERS